MIMERAGSSERLVNICNSSGQPNIAMLNLHIAINGKLAKI
jgi:hypothetical protein